MPVIRDPHTDKMWTIGDYELEKQRRLAQMQNEKICRNCGDITTDGLSLLIDGKPITICPECATEIKIET